MSTYGQQPAAVSFAISAVMVALACSSRILPRTPNKGLKCERSTGAAGDCLTQRLKTVTLGFDVPPETPPIRRAADRSTIRFFSRRTGTKGRKIALSRVSQ